MSHENVEIIRRAYEAGSRGDWDAGLLDLHPDCELTFEAGPRAGTHRGREEIVAVLSDLTAGFDAWILEPLEFAESGDQVVVVSLARASHPGRFARSPLSNSPVAAFPA